MALDIQHLRYFAAVAEAGSVSRAARRLNIAQSALSRRMRNLELSAGAEILVRTPEGVDLTSAGRRLLLHAQRIFRAFEDLHRDLSITDEWSPTPIYLGVTPSASYFIFQLMSGEAVALPRPGAVKVVEGTSEHIYRRLLSGDVDLALLTNPRHSRAIEVLVSWTEDLFVVGPRGMIGDSETALRHLADLPFVLTSTSPGVASTFEQAFARAGLKFRIDIALESVSAAKRMVENGQGFTILPFPAVAIEAAEGRLGVERLPGATMIRSLARRANRPWTAATRQVIGALRNEMERQVALYDWSHPMERRHRHQS